ncbi:hypothetical protein KUCAC02_020621 [Chaenocephalus aceratus]|nr:hypothetical protein KUCAC02_020621 [Chaenocephalus aceratus]
MAEDVSVSEDTLTCALSLLLNLSEVLLQTARQEAAESLEKFVPHKIAILFGLITAGGDFYKSLGVKKRSEAEAIWKKFYHNATVRDKVEELLQLESEWDSFLESVDRGLQTTDRQLSGGKMAASLSPDTAFTDARSGESVTLGQFLGRGEKTLLVLIRHYG